MSNKSIKDVINEQVEKFGTGNNTYEDFKIGVKVKIITPCQDFNFFYGENGTVIDNKGRYLGIKVKFDEPREFKDGNIQYSFNFEPQDLFILKEVQKPFYRTIERNYKY